MELVRKYIEGKQKADIYFPPGRTESWKKLKEKHSNLGYYWCDFSMKTLSSKEIRQKKI